VYWVREIVEKGAKWFASQPAVYESPELRHIRLEKPFRVCLDGRKSAAAILKPAP
jgi:hypothetical protein